MALQDGAPTALRACISASTARPHRGRSGQPEGPSKAAETTARSPLACHSIPQNGPKKFDLYQAFYRRLLKLELQSLVLRMHVIRALRQASTRLTLTRAKYDRPKGRPAISQLRTPHCTRRPSCTASDCRRDEVNKRSRVKRARWMTKDYMYSINYVQENTTRHRRAKLIHDKGDHLSTGRQQCHCH